MSPNPPEDKPPPWPTQPVPHGHAPGAPPLSDEADKPKNWASAKVGMAIGSAAIVAALLYVNHAKRKNEEERM